MITNKMIHDMSNNKSEISEEALKILMYSTSEEELVEKTSALSEVILEIYPKDYEQYLRKDFEKIDKQNVKSALKQIILLCTSVEV